MENSKLSEHFSLFEFCETSRPEFWEANYRYAKDNVGKLVLLAKDLEVVRARFEKGITITSGVRCPELNKAIGGSPTSQHTRAEAVDFIIPGLILLDVFRWIVDGSGLKYGQVIHEGAGHRIWIHYSLGEPYRSPERCRQSLVYKDGVYTKFPAA